MEDGPVDSSNELEIQEWIKLTNKYQTYNSKDPTQQSKISQSVLIFFSATKHTKIPNKNTKKKKEVQIWSEAYSCQAERMKTEAKRTLPTNETNAIPNGTKSEITGNLYAVCCNGDKGGRER